MSKRIQNDLDPLDLTTALTIDWNEKGQYWLCIGNKVWVCNYRLATATADGQQEQGVWYALELPDTPTCFVVVNSEMYFGTTAGQIMRFDANLKTYNGTTINAVWEMGFFNFGVEWLRKFIQRIFVTILPLVKTHVDLTYQTDRNGSLDTYTASYALNNFDHMNFAAFSFATNYSPQPFKFKVRAKKIDYFKLVLTNDGTDSATVLSVTIPSRTGGEIKNRS